MIHIALHEPEIPPNTGNIIRLCANTGAHLHLIHPLGFQLTDKALRRAGLDYHDLAGVSEHRSYAEFCVALPGARQLAFSTKATTRYDQAAYRDGDVLLFGPETRRLPASLVDALPAEQRLCLPMLTTSRSLNLSNAVAVAVYEAWRQLGFAR